MILIAITFIVIVGLALGTAATYFLAREDVTQTQEESIEIHGERVKEEITITVNSVDTSTKEVDFTIKNDWADNSEIKSLMIICDDGEKHIKEFEIDLPTGESKSFSYQDVNGDGVVDSLDGSVDTEAKDFVEIWTEELLAKC